ncbi:hypothetical protein AAP_05791 [Ascosphaera apis ARSEF 7405]|uniref:Uncharacterized protein n=1 Tax=Ascosphaera apis ARSEF 7405 TaxID=392613 RepID=A0A167VAI6_9EURO|nr:hypothetical protein AAP_05791 [Ascosphaera apis ARSEF 7405]
MKNPSQTPTLRRRKATKKAAKTPAKEERQACATFEAFGKRDKGSQILQSSTEQRSAAQPSTEIMSTNKGTDQNNDRNEAGSCGRTTSRSESDFCTDDCDDDGLFRYQANDELDKAKCNNTRSRTEGESKNKRPETSLT